MNEAGNGVGSITVGLPELRRGLLVQRTAVGAETPAGHRYSNLDEMLQNRETATGDQLRNLNRDIAVQVAELASIHSKGERQ